MGRQFVLPPIFNIFIVRNWVIWPKCIKVFPNLKVIRVIRTRFIIHTSDLHLGAIGDFSARVNVEIYQLWNRMTVSWLNMLISRTLTRSRLNWQWRGYFLLFRQFCQVNKIKNQHPFLKEVKLVSASCSPTELLGTIEANLSHQGLVIPYSTLHILMSLSHKLLLGQDFLRLSKAILDCGERPIIFAGLINVSLTQSTLRLAQSLSVA